MLPFFPLGLLRVQQSHYLMFHLTKPLGHAVAVQRTENKMYLVTSSAESKCMLGLPILPDHAVKVSRGTQQRAAVHVWTILQWTGKET